MCSLFLNGQTKRPQIGVSCNWSQGIISISSSYIKAVEQADGLPVPFSADSSVLQTRIDRLDELVMVGGADSDPLPFGEEPHQNRGNINKEHDGYDLTLIRYALRKSSRRGLQDMNILDGGSLYQDTPATYQAPYIRHRQGADRQYGNHPIGLDTGCLLRLILNTDSLTANSFHHQAIKDPAPGYRIAARTRDSMIEAIEKEGPARVIGVQWHPEALNQGGDESSRRLFRELVRQASLKH